jgi:TonB family protein
VVFATPASATPTLVSSVDVEISQAALKRLRKPPEVLVDLTIAPSGRVVDAAVRESSHPSLVDPVLASVRQWVFAPLQQTTQHFVRIALSVNAE